MKKTKIAILLLLFFTATFSLYSGFSYQVDFISRYIFRGFDLNPVKKPVIQPQVTYNIGGSGFAVNLWFNFSFEDKEANETDFIITYDFKTPESFILSLGFIHYAWYLSNNFKFHNNTTHEFYVTAGLPKVLLGPAITLYYDFHNGNGLYADLSLGHSFKLRDKAKVDLSAILGYNGGQWQDEMFYEDTGFSDLSLSIALSIKLGKFTITPFAVYTFVLMNAIGDNDHFWFGIRLLH
jgi:uncharacterized protein (TIGR02001 family)